MTTHKTTTKSASKPAKHISTKTETTPMHPSIAVPTATASAATSASSAAPPATPAPSPTSELSLAFPPADANIPVPPSGTPPTSGSDNNGSLLPRKSEQAALAAAISDLQKFPNYAVLLAVTALPQAHVVQVLQLGQAWTSMHNKSSAWDAFCRIQEGLAWTGIRSVMERLKPAYDLATVADPSMATQLAGLTALLSAQKVIAKKSASTRQLNKKAIAEGKAPTHGKVGKARARAAAKAALAQSTATPASPAAPSPAVPAASETAPATTPTK